MMVSVVTIHDFNPRSHERSDSRYLCTLKYKGISIHAPTRGATKILACLRYGIQFQSTLPREERRNSDTINGYKPNFNPRSHERSDAQRTPILIKGSISIHAPTRGAT